MRSVVGLDGLRGLFEPKRFNDSMILILVWCRDIAVFMFFMKQRCLLESNSSIATAVSVCRVVLVNVNSIPYKETSPRSL